MTRLMKIFLVAAFVASASPALAQDRTNISSGGTLPATCIVGDVYMKTGASAGVYACLTANTWTASGGGGSPAGSTGNLQINNAGSFGAYAGSAASANQVVTALDASGAVTSAAVTNAMLAGSIAASKLVGTDIATVGTITAGTWNGTTIGVTKGGTGLTAGTAGGILGFTASGVLASSALLTANMPLIGGGAAATPSVGTVSGNTTKFATMSGSITSGNCVKVDASGNLVDFGGACGGSGSPGGADTQVQFNDSSSFGGNSGFTFNKTAHTAILTGTFKAAGYSNAYTTGTSTATLAATDGVYECLTNAFTVNLPTASGITGRVYTVKNLQTANVCTVDPAGAETIDGAATASVVNGSLTFQSDGTNWRSIGSSGIPIGALAQGDILYSSAANTLTSLAKSTSSTRLLTNTGSSNNPAWAQADLTTAVTGVLPAANGGTGANGSIALNTPLIHVTAVCQNTTASIGVSTPTSNPMVAACVTGSNTQFAVARATATGQSVQGQVPIVETLNSTTITVGLQYYQTTTQTGAPTFTFSWARVGAAGTLDPSFTDCDSSGTTAATGGQLHVNTWTCTVTSLAKGDVLFWKFSYKTAPSGGASDMNFISLNVMPVAAKPVGGG